MCECVCQLPVDSFAMAIKKLHFLMLLFEWASINYQMFSLNRSTRMACPTEWIPILIDCVLFFSSFNMYFFYYFLHERPRKNCETLVKSSITSAEIIEKFGGSRSCTTKLTYIRNLYTHSSKIQYWIRKFNKIYSKHKN